MRPNDFRALAFLVPATLAIVACSAAESGKKQPDPPASARRDTGKDDDRTSTEDSNLDTNRPTTPPPQTQPRPDAGAPAKPPPKAEVTELTCRMLVNCARGLKPIEQIAATMVAAKNNQIYCAVAAGFCEFGLLDLDAIFGGQGGSRECGDLARCCTRFQDQGNDITARDCTDWATGGSDTECREQLQTYQSAGECN